VADDKKGDPDKDIADYTHAVRLNPPKPRRTGKLPTGLIIVSRER